MFSIFIRNLLGCFSSGLLFKGSQPMDKDSGTTFSYPAAMRTALTLLARRDHTCAELKRKLGQRGFKPDVIAQVISECEGLNYINDETTAQVLLEGLVRKGVGIRRIRQTMRQRGVSRSQIDRSLDENNLLDRELDIARIALEKKERLLANGGKDNKRKEKLIRFLQYRGFTPGTISALFDQINGVSGPNGN